MFGLRHRLNHFRKWIWKTRSLFCTFNSWLHNFRPQFPVNGWWWGVGGGEHEGASVAFSPGNSWPCHTCRFYTARAPARWELPAALPCQDIGPRGSCRLLTWAWVGAQKRAAWVSDARSPAKLNACMAVVPSAPLCVHVSPTSFTMQAPFCVCACPGGKQSISCPQEPKYAHTTVHTHTNTHTAQLPSIPTTHTT